MVDRSHSFERKSHPAERLDPPAPRPALRDAGAIAVVARTSPAAAPSGAGARILVVDDSAENVRLLLQLLEPLGAELLTASNGREALAQVAAFPPDLILLDIVMPELSGHLVCEQLKADPRTRLIPVVILTGLHGEQDKLRAIEAGADDFLNKPFSRAELLARARALLKLKRYTDELEHAEATLLTLASAVESRDPHTGNHCERLACMGVRLGEQLGLPPDSLQALRRGGYLHDIGKVAIPDAILLKPARLTEEEWTVMRRHPSIGEEICRPLRSLAAVLPIVRHHHERFDGSGYPDRLRGEAIPLLARILQLVDVYDALRTARPYKPALTPADACRQLRREAGQGWLDAKLLEAFLARHDSIVEVSWPMV
jgi:putative two-component system response regulator